MTLKELRGLCLLEVGGNLANSVNMPDANGGVRKAIRETVRALNGLERSTTIVTTSGTREYGTDSYFPSDFMAVEGVHDDTNDHWLKLIHFDQQLVSSTGTPEEYYIRNRKVGFEREPDVTITLTMYYRGFGDDVTNDTDVVLPEYSLADDDSLWDAIAHQFAYNVWSKKLSDFEHDGNEKGIVIANNAMNRHEKKMLQERHRFAEQLDGWNQDQAFQVDLPSGYFAESESFITVDHGRVIRRR